MSALEQLAEQAERATRQAERLNRMLALARELGDEGLAELVALVGAPTLSEAAASTEEDGQAARADGPRGREAVRVIVARRPGIWTLAELQEEMVSEGWFTSKSALDAAVKRLCDINREGRRVGTGQYVFPANYGEEDAIERDPSDRAMIPFAA